MTQNSLEKHLHTLGVPHAAMLQEVTIRHNALQGIFDQHSTNIKVIKDLCREIGSDINFAYAEIVSVSQATPPPGPTAAPESRPPTRNPFMAFLAYCRVVFMVVLLVELALFGPVLLLFWTGPIGVGIGLLIGFYLLLNIERTEHYWENLRTQESWSWLPPYEKLFKF